MPIVCFLSPGAVCGQSGSLIELVTLEPGDVVWSIFGHIGIRVLDGEGRSDMFYDYGHARFKDWSFTVNYLQGDCRFYLAERPWSEVVSTYRDRNRTIVRQRINLTGEQERRLILHLRQEALPENREYVYDQLLHNCSTRLRDLLDDITGGSLRQAAAEGVPGRRYRDYLLGYTSGSLLWQLVLDILIGPNHDREVGSWESMYLPLNLRQTASWAVTTIDGSVVPLLSEPVIEYERSGAPRNSGRRYRGRYLFLSACFAIGVFLGLHSRLERISSSRLPRILDRAAALAFICVGILFGTAGVLVLFSVLTSSVSDYRWNHNIFVFVSLDFVFTAIGIHWLIRGRPWTGWVVMMYLIVRLTALASVTVFKLTGIFSFQDNWVFMASSAIIFIGICKFYYYRKRMVC
ncbi:MAG: DUF4105 domain-containing protein [bacterium]|nr:MAG: DUF4105 domain-containing protein [bacterium]